MSEFRDVMADLLTPKGTMGVERIVSVQSRRQVTLQHGEAITIGGGVPKVGDLCSVITDDHGNRYALRTASPRKRRRGAVRRLPSWSGTSAIILDIWDNQWLQSAAAQCFEDSLGYPWVMVVQREAGSINSRIAFYRCSPADRTGTWNYKGSINLYGYAGHPDHGDVLMYPYYTTPGLVYDRDNDRGYFLFLRTSWNSEDVEGHIFDVDAEAQSITIGAAVSCGFLQAPDDRMYPQKVFSIDAVLSADKTPWFAMTIEQFNHLSPGFLSNSVGQLHPPGTYQYAVGFLGPYGEIGPGLGGSRTVVLDITSAGSPSAGVVAGGSLTDGWYTYRGAWAQVYGAQDYIGVLGARSNSVQITPSTGHTIRLTYFPDWYNPCHLRIYRRSWGASPPPPTDDKTGYYYIGNILPPPPVGGVPLDDAGGGVGGPYLYDPPLRRGKIQISTLPYGPPGTTSRIVYRSKMGETQLYRALALFGNSPGTLSPPEEDVVLDDDLTVPAPHGTQFPARRRTVVVRSGQSASFGSPIVEWPGGETSMVNTQVAMAFDHFDSPTIVRGNRSDSAVSYMRKTPGGWSIEQLIHQFTTGQFRVGSMVEFDGTFYVTGVVVDWTANKSYFYVLSTFPTEESMSWYAPLVVQEFDGYDNLEWEAPVLCMVDGPFLVMLTGGRLNYYLKLLYQDEWRDDRADAVIVTNEGFRNAAPKNVGSKDTWMLTRYDPGYPEKLIIVDWRG